MPNPVVLVAPFLEDLPVKRVSREELKTHFLKKSAFHRGCFATVAIVELIFGKIICESLTCTQESRGVVSEWCVSCGFRLDCASSG